jgi:hypothetical protein
MPELPDPAVFVVEKQCDEKGMRISSFDKTLIAIIIGIIFFIIASPLVFKLTNKATMLANISTIKPGGGITTFGLILHTVLFIAAVRLLMH